MEMGRSRNLCLLKALLQIYQAIRTKGFKTSSPTGLLKQANSATPRPGKESDPK